MRTKTILYYSFILPAHPARLPALLVMVVHSAHIRAVRAYEHRRKRAMQILYMQSERLCTEDVRWTRLLLICVISKDNRIHAGRSDMVSTMAMAAAAAAMAVAT